MTHLTMISRFLSHSPHLTTIQIGVLLASQGEKRTLTALSELLFRSEAIIGVNVNKLVEQRLLEKLPDLADLRKYFIMLSPRGQRLVLWAIQEL